MAINFSAKKIQRMASDLTWFGVHDNELTPDKNRIPELNLWSAVLQIATLDAANEKTSAIAWFLSKSLEIGSFLYICEVLSINNPSEIAKVMSSPTRRNQIARYLKNKRISDYRTNYKDL